MYFALIFIFDQSLNVMQIAVLGAGMVGRAIAIDLAKDFDVTSFDLNPANLQELHKRNKAIKGTPITQR